MSTLTAEQQQIKDEFVAVRGTWGEPWQRMLELDPAFVRAYLHWLLSDRAGQVSGVVLPVDGGYSA
jgi:NAD(P)-dependent dehydrogenase (short-subunit alcohol dehydrogenase family)